MPALMQCSLRRSTSTTSVLPSAPAVNAADTQEGAQQCGTAATSMQVDGAWIGAATGSAGLSSTAATRARHAGAALGGVAAME